MNLHQTWYEWSAWIWPALPWHLWQATLFFGVILIVAMLLRRAPARARHALFLIAAVKFITPSIVIVYFATQLGVDWSFLPAFQTPAAIATVIPQVAEPVFHLGEPIITGSSNGAETLAGHPEIFCLLTIVWFLGCSFFLSRWWVLRRRTMRTIKTSSVVVTERELRILARVRNRLGIRRTIQLMSTTGIEPLGVCGSWKPRVLFPKNVIEYLEDEELETILLHELIHIRRWDNVISNFQMLLCSAFWFYPLVWILDRKLLTERERACDDEVLSAGAESKVYVSSLVKVSRFAMGMKTAGVSGAAESDVRSRLERIMDRDVARRLSGGHRLFVTVCASGVIIFSAVMGLLSGEFASAQNATGILNQTDHLPQTSSPHEPPNGNAVNEPANVAFIQENVSDAVKKLTGADEVSIRVENLADAPLRVIEAKVKVVPLQKDSEEGQFSEELVAPSTVLLVNQTDVGITLLRLSLRAPAKWHDIVGFEVSIEPHGVYVLHADSKTWTNTIKRGNARNLLAQVIGVQFQDGTTWGRLDSPALPSSVAAADQRPEIASPVPDMHSVTPPSGGDGRIFPARFSNPVGAPVIILAANSKSVARPPGMVSIGSTNQLCTLPVVSLSNVSSRRVVALKLRFKADVESHAVTAFRVTIAPNSSFIFRRNSTMSGDAERMRVQVVGVEFEDGSVWGAMTSLIYARDEVVPIPLSISKPDPSKNSGVSPTPLTPRASYEGALRENMRGSPNSGSKAPFAERSRGSPASVAR